MDDIHQVQRLDATFGNSAYLAVYALFHFLAMFLFVRDAVQPLRYVYPVIALVNVVVLYYTQTRGCSGLVGGIRLFSLSFLTKNSEWKLCNRWLVGYSCRLFIQLKIVWIQGIDIATHCIYFAF